MTTDLPTLKEEAQQVLVELWIEKLIPFELNVGKLTNDGDEYTIHFYDCRMFTARFFFIKGHSFKALVRSAVIARVVEMRWPFQDKESH